MNSIQHPFVIVTGASSGVGLYATDALIRRGWHVIMACGDIEKTQRVASEMKLSTSQLTIMKLNLSSLQSVRDFVTAYIASGWPLHALLNNATVTGAFLSSLATIIQMSLVIRFCGCARHCGIGSVFARCRKDRDQAGHRSSTGGIDDQYRHQSRCGIQLRWQGLCIAGRTRPRFHDGSSVARCLADIVSSQKIS